MPQAPAVRSAFAERFGGEPRLFYAPGRVNLIGEHTDYNDGFVLPLAINRGVTVAARVREDRRLRVCSLQVGEVAEIDLDDPGARRTGTWLDYVRGVACTLAERRLPIRGADVVLTGDVPSGAGLSSSAALEVAVGFALTRLSAAAIERVHLALACQSAEQVWVGTSCGIMDQYVSALGRSDHALLVDCRTLEHTDVPLDGERVHVVICDSKVKHELSSSAYNDRRSECDRAAAILSRYLPGLRALRDVTPAQLDAHRERVPPPLDRRARHVVHENARTLAASQALREGRFEEAGALLYESHASLRDDYEVSCPELDALVELARGVPGVYGARMTGGGFGGCTVNLVEPGAVQSFETAVREGFAARFGAPPDVFVTRACDGARELEGG